MQSEKLASALDPDKDEETDKLVKDDCELCYAAMEIFLDLKAYKGKLEQAKQNQQKLQNVQPEDPTSEALISLQQDMQKHMTAQLKQQQNEFSFRQEMRHEEKSSVKLPKLEMISFGGDKTRWVEFWDSFRNSVHNNSHISNVEKFNYLKSKLFGEARRSIAGLALSSENYSVAVDVLKDRFGNPQEIIDLHYNQLIHLASANNKVASLRTLSDNIEKHLRSLQVLNQNIDQDVFVSIIRSKLPEEVLVQLEIQNGADKKWSVATLNKRLREYVIARERAEKRSRGQAEKQEFQQHNRVCDRTNAFTKTNAPRSSFTSHYNSSAQALVSANVKSSSEKGKEKQVMSKQDVKIEKRETYATKCRYCEGDHWSDECFNYKTLEERKRQLRGACYKCVKDGHKSQDCRANKKCLYCSKINSHHRSLCPEKFKVKETRVHMSEELRESPQAEQLEKRTVTPALISSNEMVLMQTAKTEIVNPSNSIRATTRLLLDSGSQRTYITERLASQLGLKGHTEEELKLVTFGSDKPKVIKTMSTSLNLKLNNSSFMTITANIVPTISGTIQRNVVPSSLSEQLQNLIHSVELADTLPSERETSTIEMLIGNDYYLDIVLPNRIEIQPGLYLLASKFGWILTGRTTEKIQDISEVNMFVMTYANDVTGSNVFTSLDPSMKVEPELQDFWRLETIGIRDEIEVTNDEVAMKKFRDTLTFQNDRYQVTWPWREEEFDLPVNRQLAMGRLKSAVSRLSDKPKIMEKYKKY